jgi:hypothetical protein
MRVILAVVYSQKGVTFSSVALPVTCYPCYLTTRYPLGNVADPDPLESICFWVSRIRIH